MQKITIRMDILQKANLSFGEYLVLLLGYSGHYYEECFNRLLDKGLIQKNVFDKRAMVLSDNTEDMISKIIMASDDKATSCGIDFTHLAQRLQEIYPHGTKEGTTYSWRDKTENIAHKLRTLVVQYDFSFTEEEAIKATEEYANSFKENKTHMQLLKYFILKTTNSDGKEISSPFMTIIENNR